MTDIMEQGVKGIELPSTMKICSTCKKTFARTDEFYSKRAASKDGLSYSCKTCERETAMRSYRKRKRKSKDKKYYENNRERLLDQSKENYQDNKKVRLEQCKEYRQNNPETARKADKKRRERLATAEKDGVTRDEIIERDSIAGIPYCQICNMPITDIKELQIDHKVPLAAGGADTADNKRVVHKSCNISRPKDGRDLK